jgi:hypothetical protein
MDGHAAPLSGWWPQPVGATEARNAVAVHRLFKMDNKFALSKVDDKYEQGT